MNYIYKKILSKLFSTLLIFVLVMSLLVPTVSANTSKSQVAVDVVAPHSEKWNIIESQTTNDHHKVWKVNLSHEIKESSVNSENVFVINSEKQLVSTTYSVKKDQISVTPVSTYKKGEVYTLYILPSVKSKKGMKLNQPTKFTFEVLKDAVVHPATEERVVEVTDTGDGRAEGDEMLVAVVDSVTNKTQALVSYLNEEGRQAAMLFKAESHDPMLERMNVIKVSLSDEEFSLLHKDTNIEYIERNILMEEPNEISAIPNRYKELLGFYKNMTELKSGDLATWGYKTLGLEGSVEMGISGKGVKIAVLDSGVSDHPDLKVSGGMSQVRYTNSYADDRGHGTHVAGIISAKLDGQGLAGVAPDADLYSVKTMNSEGKGAHGDIVLGIIWAIENGMDVINISTGSSYYSPIYEKIIQEAVERNVVIVASSGNTGTGLSETESISYPAKYKETIAVGSIDSSLIKSDFSSTGKSLDFVAPGGGIVSTDFKGGYIQKSGTSMSAPQITGMIALLKQAFPGKTPEAYKQLLINHTIDLGAKGKDTLYGYGMVNFGDLFRVVGEIPESEEPEKVEPSIPTPEIKPVDPMLKYRFEAAERNVKDVEREGSSQATRDMYARLATISVYSLPESQEKQELISRLQANGVYKPEPTKLDIDFLKAESIVIIAEGKEGMADDGYTRIVREDAVNQVNALPGTEKKRVLEGRLRVIGLLPPIERPSPIEPEVKPKPENPVPEFSESEMSPLDKVLFQSAELDVKNVERSSNSPSIQETYNRLAMVSVYDLPERKEKKELVRRLQAKGVYTPEPTKGEIDILKAEITVSVAESKKGLPNEGYTKHIRESAINKVAALSASDEKKMLEERLRVIGLVLK